MGTSWYGSTWFRVVVILLVLVVAGLLAAPYFFDINRYRPAIVDLLKKESGRDVAIEKLRLHFLPLRVEVLNFRVLNPPGFPAGETLAVRRIGVGLAWRPLLDRQIQIRSVTFDDFTLHLLENEAGETNYDTLSKLQAKPKRSARKPTATSEVPPVTLTQIDDIRMNNVELSSGSFWRRNQQVHPNWRVTGLAASARNFDFTRPDWQKQVEAEVLLDKVELAVPALKEPMRFPGGRLAVRNNAAEGEFNVAVGKFSASGRVRVADLSKPVAEFQVTAGEVNVPDVAALLASKRPGGPSGSSGGGPGPTKLLAKGTVQVKKLNLPPVSAENLEAAVRLYTTRIEIDPLTMALYGGSLKGMSRMELAYEGLPAGIALVLEGVDMGKVSAAASPEKKSQVTGKLKSKVDLQLNLGAAKPFETLSGNGSFAIRDGMFPGLNLGGTLGGLAKFLSLGVPEGDTKFRALGGDLRIARQRVHSQQVKLDAEGLEAAVSGSVGFDRTLDYTGWGTLKSAPQSASGNSGKNPLSVLGRGLGQVMTQTVGRAGMMRIPFTVRGTVDEPKFSLAGSPQPVQTSQEQTAPTTEQKKKKRFGIF